jgi:predicted anti-sigma-YlaC factor YlaD
MNCNEFVELITDYLEHQLDEARHAWTADHLEVCGKCRNYLNQMEQTIATLRRLGDEKLAPTEYDQIMAALRARRPLV